MTYKLDIDLTTIASVAKVAEGRSGKSVQSFWTLWTLSGLSCGCPRRTSEAIKPRSSRGANGGPHEQTEMEDLTEGPEGENEATGRSRTRCWLQRVAG